MQRKILRPFIGVVLGLLALAGCDTPVGDEGYWLADVANPFIRKVWFNTPQLAAAQIR